MSNRSPSLKMRVSGMFACFSRPEFKAERMSYQVPTPTAVRGIYSAVIWKPAIAWHVTTIHVCRPIRFISFRRNEVNSKAAIVKAAVVNGGGAPPIYCADEDRAQRNTMALYDVEYVFEAFFSMTDAAGEGDNVTKFVDMFKRRLAKGQCFTQPYLGCREFAAEVRPFGDNESISTIGEDRELGMMLGDILFEGATNRARFFEARLENGTLHVPGSIYGGE